MTTDNSENKNSTKILLVLAILFLVLVAGVLLLLPDLSSVVSEFQNGVGFKDAAIYSFFTTLILLVILAVAGGDGLIGELQFLLAGFLIFFFIIWLFIAWIF
jgi:hypothetical protein